MSETNTNKYVCRFAVSYTSKETANDEEPVVDQSSVASARPNLPSARGQSTGGQSDSSHVTLPETDGVYRFSPIRE